MSSWNCLLLLFQIFGLSKYIFFIYRKINTSRSSYHILYFLSSFSVKWCNHKLWFTDSIKSTQVWPHELDRDLHGDLQMCTNWSGLGLLLLKSQGILYKKYIFADITPRDPNLYCLGCDLEVFILKMFFMWFWCVLSGNSQHFRRASLYLQCLGRWMLGQEFTDFHVHWSHLGSLLSVRVHRSHPQRVWFTRNTVGPERLHFRDTAQWPWWRWFADHSLGNTLVVENDKSGVRFVYSRKKEQYGGSHFI